MDKFIGWLTHNKLLILSLLGSIVFFISIFAQISVPVDVCYQGEFCGNVSEVLRIYFLLFVPILFFSLITLKAKKSSILWKKFTFIYLFIFYYDCSKGQWFHILVISRHCLYIR